MLVCHALLRTRWQADFDEDHALELCHKLGETKAVLVRDLLEVLPPASDSFQPGDGKYKS